MTTAISDATRRTCEIYSRAIAGGESEREVIGYLAAQYGVNRPAIWRRLRSGGVLPGYHRRENMGRRAAGIAKPTIQSERIVPPTLPVDRDPCQRCGVRRDIGCNHSRVPLGMVL